MNEPVLVLNQNYEPLNVTNLKRAVVLVYLGKAEIIQTNSQWVNSVSFSMECPSVVKLMYFVRRPNLQLRLTKQNIIARDNFSCQYCGASDGGLTVDHIIPKNRGGATDWENLVCCCMKCNLKKGNRMPDEVNMELLRRPRKPRYVPYMSLRKFVRALRNPEWQEYLQAFAEAVGIAD